MYILAINNDFDSSVDLVQVQIYKCRGIDGRVDEVVVQLHEKDKIEVKTILRAGQQVYDTAKIAWSEKPGKVYEEAIKYIWKYHWKDLISL